MTTTGFGDFTPAQRGGRAVAVLEMLIGQIYLVTVISLLVGNLRRRREAADARGRQLPLTAAQASEREQHVAGPRARRRLRRR